MTPAPKSTEAPSARENAELIGHQAAEQVLLRAQASGRLPHAWLITGPRGIGKATLAYRFARFLLSGRGGGGDLFGDAPESLAVAAEDPVFRRIAARSHGDLRTLERRPDEKNPSRMRREIVVEDLRKAVDFLHLTAAAGGWRIVIVDPAEDMNLTTANALLKMLEEPSDQSLLLLVSHSPGRLLATIRSRCCHLALTPLADAEVRGLLTHYRPELGPGEVDGLVGLAEGSIGRALDLAAGGGLELYEELVALLGTLPEVQVKRVHAFGDRLAKETDGSSFRTGTQLLLWWLARMIRGQAEGHFPNEVTAGESAAMARLSGRGNLEQWLGLWEKLAQLFARCESANLDRRQVVVTAFLELEGLTR